MGDYKYLNNSWVIELELLVNGYIKQEFQSQIPTEIIALCFEFCNEQWMEGEYPAVVELHKIYEHHEIKYSNPPLLVLANKQDDPYAMSVEMIHKK